VKSVTVGANLTIFGQATMRETFLRGERLAICCGFDVTNPKGARAFTFYYSGGLLLE
jgi:hypothetical protein